MEMEVILDSILYLISIAKTINVSNAIIYFALVIFFMCAIFVILKLNSNVTLLRKTLQAAKIKYRDDLKALKENKIDKTIIEKEKKKLDDKKAAFGLLFLCMISFDYP